MIRPAPLANPGPLIRRVYAYVAYRIGDGPDAEDVTSEVFERALRHLRDYDPCRGDPVAWLLGIARRAIADYAASRATPVGEVRETASPTNLEEQAVLRLTLTAALARLSERDRELLALRYGADLTARQIADLLGLTTNAVEVALHRTLARLRARLAPEPAVKTDVRISPSPTVLVADKSTASQGRRRTP